MGNQKWPRAANVDVVATPDDKLSAAQLGSPSRGPSLATPVSPAIDTDICHLCDAIEPPPHKNAKQRGPVNWVKCDACPHWYCTVCVGVRNTKDKYHCEMCC